MCVCGSEWAISHRIVRRIKQTMNAKYLRLRLQVVKVYKQYLLYLHLISPSALQV